MPTELPDISPEEWERAENYFRDNPTAVKMKRSDETLSPSFIKVGDEIYAMAVHDYLGKGAFGKAKKIKNKKNETFAVKIEGRDLRKDDDMELQVMEILGYSKGQVVRRLNLPKIFLNRITTKKLYTVTELRKGNELFKRLYEESRENYFKRRNDLSESDRLLIALKSCDAIQQLHDKRIIHADIKPANFMFNNEDDMITIASIDYGFSMLLKEEQTEFQPELVSGTLDYMAPELLNNGTYSFASDIYALGIMFRMDLQLPSQIFQPMLEWDRFARTGLDTTILRIATILGSRLDLSEQERSDIIAIRSKAQESILKRIENLDPEKLYVQLSRGSTLLNPAKWMYEKSKSVGKVITQKGKRRKAQLAAITEALNSLKTDDDPHSRSNKRTSLYILLNSIRDDISKEHNVFSSGMKKMCEKIMNDLELIDPKLKTPTAEAKPWDSIRSEIEDPSPTTSHSKNKFNPE